MITMTISMVETLSSLEENDLDTMEDVFLQFQEEQNHDGDDNDNSDNDDNDVQIDNGINDGITNNSHNIIIDNIGDDDSSERGLFDEVIDSDDNCNDDDGMISINEEELEGNLTREQDNEEERDGMQHNSDSDNDE